MGAAIADVVGVTDGMLCAYELKSERDTLVRLPEQIRAYSEGADLITVVCAPVHRRDVLLELARARQTYVGVTVFGDVEYDVVRYPQTSPHVTFEALLAHLWNEDLRALLEERGWAEGVRGRSRYVMTRRLRDRGLELADLRAFVGRTWESRDWGIWQKRREEKARRRRERRGR